MRADYGLVEGSPDGWQQWFSVTVRIAHGEVVLPATHRWRVGPTPLPFKHRNRGWSRRG